MLHWSLYVQVALIAGAIVLPHPNRVEHYQRAVSRADLIENAYIVANAAERWSTSQGGVYPSSVGQMADFLPGRRPLKNPITGLRTEPVDGQAASAGQIGYTPWNIQGYDVGYTITVFGKDNTVGPNRDGILFTLVKVTDPPPPPPR